ncbi:MAG TPA: 2-isopropylmalate synthase [Hyphomicrobiaceae bacterium]|nr:2-isopropylmalate synthase [Hyphomicrobiaceae bacterium]
MTDIAQPQKPRSDTDRVMIFDTTLRDGEQSPGAAMTLDNKLSVARLLDEMGVDIIEAGFPASSNGDFEAVAEIAKVVKRAVVCGLARSSLGDIDRAGEAVKHAVRPRVHTFISTSPVHRKYKLNMSAEQVIDAVAKSVERARRYTDNVEWSAEDATRTERDVLLKCCEVAIKAGATTINIPDTVGYSVPEEYFALIKMLRETVPGGDTVVWSTHCHNDLGMAVANSLAGVRAGARQIECTINGLGERAGNAALEEIVMAMNVRNDVLPYWNEVDTTKFVRASKLVAAVSAFPVQYNKAIVGRNAFSHESGIHQDGMLKNAETYEIMRPEAVGLSKSHLSLGKLSGRAAFRDKLKALGYELGDNAFQDAFRRFKDLADKKKLVFDEDIEALVDQEVASQSDRIKVVALTVIAGTGGPQKATITLEVDGRHETREASGDGPVDATFKAIKAIVPHEVKLPLYQVMAVTEGTDAQAEVMVRLEEAGRTVTGRGADTDTMVASARAYVSALNKLLMKRQRGPSAQSMAS